MARCSGIKGDGSRCEGIAKAGASYCYAHDPERADERRRNASRGGTKAGRGRAQLSPEIPAIKVQLQTLANDVLAGDQDRGRAAVANQILNTPLRALEAERKIREQEEIIARLETLEQRYEQNRDKRYGFGR
jgi:hypothetical protein